MGNPFLFVPLLLSNIMDLLWILGLSLVAYGAALYLRRIFRHRQFVKQTCVQQLLDIDSLGLRLPHEKIEGTAVICGGRGMDEHAGCNAGGPWNQLESKRARVMQYDSLHIILPMGYKAMAKLFPNIEEQGKASSIKVGPSNWHVHFWGNDTRAPDAEYGGTLPKSIYTGRAGIETLLRRLVPGGDYKNIRQVIGTVTGVSRNANSPEFIDQVTVRTSEGIRTTPAALVVGAAAAAGRKWLRREGYGFADRYGRNQLPLDQLKIAYDQKLHCTILQFRITPELGRKLPGLPVPYDECRGIYNNSTDSKNENRCVYSQRVDEEIIIKH
ncbi:hypothetical protein EV421DRAFT_1736204 [Armillaria borealis]|uniref:Uncharacterized protein n=1 Tax=Armillaria borealis TaxID=47425 RepID=A0AA39JI14_9AGAR|nr:hypothetical protein EV421DRAFT_1736204 [Armillaria borealis]